MTKNSVKGIVVGLPDVVRKKTKWGHHTLF